MLVGCTWVGCGSEGEGVLETGGNVRPASLDVLCTSVRLLKLHEILHGVTSEPPPTDTVEEFEDRIMQKKMKIPKMSIKNSGNSFENCYGDERMPLRHKKVSCGERDPSVITKVFNLSDALLSPHHLFCTSIYTKITVIVAAYVEADLLYTHN